MLEPIYIKKPKTNAGRVLYYLYVNIGLFPEEAEVLTGVKWIQRTVHSLRHDKGISIIKDRGGPFHLDSSKENRAKALRILESGKV